MRFTQPHFGPRAILLFALLALPLYCRIVGGVVTGGGGKPVARAVVRLKNSVTLKMRSVRTGADGVYRFSGLNPALDYELRASGEGKSSGWVRLTRFDEGKERTVNLVLK